MILGTILIVEDNIDDIELTRKALERENIANNFQIVRDGDEALDYIFKREKFSDTARYPTPSLILLDINLPKLNGIEVLKILKSTSGFKRIPIIMLTTSNSDRDIIESYDLGVNSYIQKPISFDKFINTIKYIESYWMTTNVMPPLGIKTQPAN